MNKSPLRYPGGKTRACKQLDSILTQYFDMSAIKTVCSPFFGGGSFEFYLQSKYGCKIIANDKFTPLYNFWISCKNNKDNLCNELYKYLGIKKDDFIEFRNKIMSEENCLQSAVYYFIINRCSFSGATLSGGFSEEASRKRFTKSSVDRINSLNLENFEIYNQDFKDFMNSHSDFTFLDPPYYLDKSNLYGYKGDLHEDFDHEKLYKVLSLRNNWMLTYNDCEYIRNLYKVYIIIDVNWSYSMNKSKKSSDIVIISKFVLFHKF
jgi:DNA adenine methylase